MTLILRKLLASSTYAISGTLEGLAKRLEAAAAGRYGRPDAPPDDFAEDWEDIDELADEWDEDEDGNREPERAHLTPEQLAELRQEMAQLREFHALAKSIVKNSKGEVLLTALRRGFAAAAEAQQQPGRRYPATEGRDLHRVAPHSGLPVPHTRADRVRRQGDALQRHQQRSHSKAIYQRWLAEHAGTDRISGSPSANMRAALVEYFRDHAAILIATEAAAEGINLQFCNLVVNYDLPWNPQRIEQRIGRCHRYGQKFDVVVVNFLNKNNAADQRVYELLDQKFRLFDGVFGASDEVLGAVESGVDFEKRIAAIYQQCRTPEQIQFEFDQLQRELETEITAGQRDAREKLLDNFDQEVVEKVRIQSHDFLDRFNEQLWRLTRHLLADYAHFADNGYGFILHTNPFPGETIHPGPYRMAKGVEDANTYRVGHPLAQRVLDAAKALAPPPAEVAFDYTGSGKNIAILEPIAGPSGWLVCARLTLSALETEDLLVLAGSADDGTTLDEAQCRRLFDLPASQGARGEIPHPLLHTLDEAQTRRRQELLEEMAARERPLVRYRDGQAGPLGRGSPRLVEGRTGELDEALKEAKKAARLAPTLPEKLERQRTARTLEGKREEAGAPMTRPARRSTGRRMRLLDEISRRLEQRIEQEPLFALRWKLI